MLVNARKAKGLTQAELAERLSRPQSYISKYERGERRVDVVEFVEIAEGLSLDPCDIIKRIQS
jgi:transcriptional regulator with XRE-family HTH domain